MKTSGPSAALRLSKGKLAGIVFVFLWFFLGGIAHFAKIDFEISMVPPYIPWPRFAVLMSGVFELLGAFGILYPPTRRLAGIGLFALTIAVTPANVYMLQRPDIFPYPVSVLVIRLILQIPLLWLIAWCTFKQHDVTGTRGDRR